MRNEASQEQIAAADAYERLFVPAEFAQWAPRILTAAGVASGHRVLDVACGTGVVARHAARLVGPSGFVAGVDPDAGMLAVASRTPSAIDWRQGDAGALPFDDGVFDAVTCQFGLMFFPDRRAALEEMWRVLAERGRLAVAVWDTLERTPAYDDVVSLLDRTLGSSVGDLVRAPFALGDVAQLRSLFESAGLKDASIATHVGTGHFPDVKTMIEAELRGWAPLAGIQIEDADIARVVREATGALARYVDRDGRVRFDAPTHIVTVTKA